MPRLSAWMVRAALLHLGIGMTLGGLILFHKAIPFAPEVWRGWPLHIELLLFGWLVQLAMGVAFWIIPRFSTPPRYGRVWLAVLAALLLNAGVWLGAAGAWWGSPAAQMLGRLSLLLAGVAFAVHIAPRVKPFMEGN